MTVNKWMPRRQRHLSNLRGYILWHPRFCGTPAWVANNWLHELKRRILSVVASALKSPESLNSRFALRFLISPLFALSSRHLLICQDWHIPIWSIFEVSFRHLASPSSMWAASGAARMALRKHKFEGSLSFLSQFGIFFLTRLSFLTEPHKI